MSRLEFNAAERRLIAKADQLEAGAKALREDAYERRRQRDCSRPLEERLIYAAVTRCRCGHGYAYDPAGEVTNDKSDSPLRRPNAWECAGILRHLAAELEEPEAARVKEAEHDGALPFAFWELKSENQPSANGRTTRGTVIPKTAEATNG